MQSSRLAATALFGGALLAPWVIACSKGSQHASRKDPALPSVTVPATGRVKLGADVPPRPSRTSSAASKPTASASASAKLLADGPLVLVRDGQPVPAARATRVLHIGDSMVPLVGNYLRPRVVEQGGKYEIISTSSSSTLSWAEGDQLQQALSKYNPELVLISLGSNELFFEDDLEQRRAAVQRIVGAVAGRACLWIGPPAWAKDRGFLGALRESLGACQYFDSTARPMQRQEDGRHPTWGASHRWAQDVWSRLGGEAAQVK